MAERIVRIHLEIEVDTNKRTIMRRQNVESLEEAKKVIEEVEEELNG